MRPLPRRLVPLLVGLLILSACNLIDISTPTAVPTAPPPWASTPSVTTRTLASTPLATAWPPATLTPAPTSAPDGVIARQHLVDLAEGIGRREAGSPEEEVAARYIAAAFADYGYDVQVQAFSFRDWNGRRKNSANVIAVKPGASPREIIVGAHYDSTGPGQGADDNASGVAVMLEVAGRVRDVPTPYTIRFIAFGAEEVDLNGSYEYVEQMSGAAIRNTVVMINLDSVVAGDIAYVYGDEGAGSLRDWILQRARETGLELDTRPVTDLDEPDGTSCYCADFVAFQEAGIPFVHLETTNWSLGEQDGATQVDPRFGARGVIWHTRYDDLTYLETTFPGRVDRHLALFSRLLYDVLVYFR